MKKLFLLSLAISALFFTSCESQDDDSTTDGYTLTITPLTAAVGDSITFTVTGDGASDLSWNACFSGPISSCLATPITGGKLVYVTAGFSAGEYTFYATSENDDETNKVVVTLTE